MEIGVNEEIKIRNFQPEDWQYLVRYLNNNRIYDNSLVIPYPYTREAAEGWINQNIQSDIPDIAKNFAIQHRAYGLIGGIGYNKNADPKLGHQVEIGYWLGEPYWNHGYMTDVVCALSEWLFKHTAFSKIVAYIFAHNPASGRVLEKCGFQREGLLRNHIVKNAEFMDCVVYGKLKG